jgi:hypothetical protein
MVMVARKHYSVAEIYRITHLAVRTAVGPPAASSPEPKPRPSEPGS